MYQVSVEEAITRLPQLIAEANGGEEVILTQNSQPVARLVAVEAAPLPRPRRPFGIAKGMGYMTADFEAPLEDFKEYVAL